MSKYSWNIVVEEMDKRGYIVRSSQSDYKNASTKIKYICPKHSDKGEQQIDTYHLVSGRGCYYCGREVTEEARRTTPNENECKMVAEENGFIYIGCGKSSLGKIVIDFLCPNHEELGVQTTALSNMKRGMKGCKYCSGKQLPEWYVRKRINELYPEVEILTESPLPKLTDYIDVRCTIHDYTYKSTIQNLLIGHKCKYCGLESLSVNKAKFCEKIHELSPDIQYIQGYGKSLRDQVVLLRCDKCGTEFSRNALYAFTNGITCPHCSSSLGELKVEEYLQSHSIKYIPQKVFYDCRDILPLRFDFFIPDLKCVIEYDGRQHFIPTSFGSKTVDAEQMYLGIKRRDKMKNDYCATNCIRIIRIPYTDFDKIETILDKELPVIN